MYVDFFDMFFFFSRMIIEITLFSLPETKHDIVNGWLEDDPLLLGFCLFSGANCLFQRGYFIYFMSFFEAKLDTSK